MKPQTKAFAKAKGRTVWDCQKAAERKAHARTMSRLTREEMAAEAIYRNMPRLSRDEFVQRMRNLGDHADARVAQAYGSWLLLRRMPPSEEKSAHWAAMTMRLREALDAAEMDELEVLVQRSDEEECTRASETHRSQSGHRGENVRSGRGGHAVDCASDVETGLDHAKPSRDGGTPFLEFAPP